MLLFYSSREAMHFTSQLLNSEIEDNANTGGDTKGDGGVRNTNANIMAILNNEQAHRANKMDRVVGSDRQGSDEIEDDDNILQGKGNETNKSVGRIYLS